MISKQDEQHARNPVEDLEQTAAEMASPGTAGETRSRATSQGPLPPVETSEPTFKPTASELGYEENLAGPHYVDPKDGAKPDKQAEIPKLLEDFAAKFPEAANLIKSCPRALQHVRDAAAMGATFGGYSEESPFPDAWPFTLGTTVYIPKAHTEKLTAMADFLFELNNAMRAPQFKKLDKEAYKGDKGTLTRESFAREKIAIEVEGMLSLGEVWLAAKTSHGKLQDKQWKKHDGEFYLELYQAHKAGKMTKAQIVERTLHTPYKEGEGAGRSPAEVYGEQFDAMASFSKQPKRPGDDGLLDPSKM